MSLFFKDNLLGELYSVIINFMTGFNCVTVSSIGNAEKVLKDSSKIKLVVMDLPALKIIALNLFLNV